MRNGFLVIICCVLFIMMGMLGEKINKLENKLFPKLVKCDRCGSVDVSEQSDNPNMKQPRVKTMNEMASGPVLTVTHEFAVMKYYFHTLKCEKCGYAVTYTRTY